MQGGVGVNERQISALGRSEGGHDISNSVNDQWLRAPATVAGRSRLRGSARFILRSRNPLATEPSCFVKGPILVWYTHVAMSPAIGAKTGTSAGLSRVRSL